MNIFCECIWIFYLVNAIKLYKVYTITKVLYEHTRKHSSIFACMQHYPKVSLVTITQPYLHALVEQLEYGAVGDEVVDLV